MAGWVTRALVLALLHAVASVLRAKAAVFRPTDLDALTIGIVALLVGAAALWAALDAWRGATDRGRTWFIAALVAGPVSGVLDVTGRALFVDRTGLEALPDALTGGAAFTALLILIPAWLGLFAGDRIARRPEADLPDQPRAKPAG
ncbi:B-4DMT family transporter [Amycolatopsis magusensis]|uniref:B-4DMT family transporter n=1 Tax=Amycolatopsis magusensis TaxID=882444 RepID=UPI0024A9712C|nr:B-4DMT family transporter [Amycolatopsis magusensis]MDI5979550.1 B-4DMT family transporter [Amycolatopsis magusensis]